MPRLRAPFAPSHARARVHNANGSLVHARVLGIDAPAVAFAEMDSACVRPPTAEVARPRHHAYIHTIFLVVVFVVLQARCHVAKSGNVFFYSSDACRAGQRAQGQGALGQGIGTRSTGTRSTGQGARGQGARGRHESRGGRRTRGGRVHARLNSCSWSTCLLPDTWRT